MLSRVPAVACVLFIITSLDVAMPSARTIRTDIPEGTRVYIALEERLRGKKGEADVGQIVRCKVWRDVVVGGVAVIRAGTPVMAKIDSMSRRKIAGIKGKMSIAAYETNAIDGQTVQLSGGYMKEGKSRMATSITLGVFIWPLIFIPGKAAELPQGMVFDAFTGPLISVENEVADSVVPVVNLAGALSPFSAEVLLDNLQQEKKPKFFNIKIVFDGTPPLQFVIDNVNGQAIEAIPLAVLHWERSSEEERVFLTQVEIKRLAKHFTKGINRFEVAYQEGAERISSEVLLNLQF